MKDSGKSHEPRSISATSASPSTRRGSSSPASGTCPWCDGDRDGDGDGRPLYLVVPPAERVGETGGAAMAPRMMADSAAVRNPGPASSS